MIPFLVAVFLKGPLWLRAIIWSIVSVFLLLGLFIAATRLSNLRNAAERPVPANVHHTHPNPSRPVR